MKALIEEMVKWLRKVNQKETDIKKIGIEITKNTIHKAFDEFNESDPNLNLKIIKVDIDTKDEEALSYSLWYGIFFLSNLIDKVIVAETENGYHIKYFLKKVPNYKQIFLDLNEKLDDIEKHYLLEFLCNDDIQRVLINWLRYKTTGRKTDFVFSFKLDAKKKEVKVSYEKYKIIYELQLSKITAKKIQTLRKNFLKKYISAFNKKIDIRSLFHYLSIAVKYGVIEEVTIKPKTLYVNAPEDVKTFIFFISASGYIRELKKVFAPKNIIITEDKSIVFKLDDNDPVFLIKKEEVHDKERIIFKTIAKKLEELKAKIS